MAARAASSWFARRIHTLPNLLRAAVNESAPPSVTVAEGGKKVELAWNGSEQWRFHSVWLRHNCQCSECLSPYGQKTAVLVDSFRKAVAQDIRIESAHLQGDELRVNWVAGQSSHSGNFPIQWLQENNYSSPDRINTRQIKPTAKTLPVELYTDVMNTDEGHWKFLKNIRDYGLCLIKGVPNSKDSVRKFAERSGPVHGSIRYGEVYSVVCVDGGIDITSTTTSLPLHSDFSFVLHPPSIMMLHCLRLDSSVVGGESVLLDGYSIAEELREKYPSQFEVLTTTPIRFKNRMLYDNGLIAEAGSGGPHIELDQDGEFKMIRFNMPFECPQVISEDKMEDYYEAYNLLVELILESDKKIVHQLQPGELYVVDNHRILHGRGAFTLNGGERHMMGLYQSADDYALRLAMVTKKLLSKT